MPKGKKPANRKKWLKRRYVWKDSDGRVWPALPPRKERQRLAAKASADKPSRKKK